MDQPGPPTAGSPSRGRAVPCLVVVGLSGLIAGGTFLPWLRASFSDAPTERLSAWAMVDNPHQHGFYVDGGPFTGTAIKHWLEGGALPVVGPASLIALAASTVVLTSVGWRSAGSGSRDGVHRAAVCWMLAAAAGLSVTMSVRWNQQVWHGAWGDFELGAGLLLTLLAGLAIAAIAGVLAIRADRTRRRDTPVALEGVRPRASAPWSRMGQLALLAALIGIAGSIELAVRSAAWSSETTAFDSLALLAATSGTGLAVAGESVALSVRLRRGAIHPQVPGVWGGVAFTLMALAAFSLASLTS